MFEQIVGKSLLALFFSLLFVACAENSVQHDEILAADIANLRVAGPGVYSAGQPGREQLAQLAGAGVKHIISLRPDTQLDWDEAAYVRSLGMTYHNIPVGGVEDISAENASKLSGLLDQFKNAPALVHCASGNRVGALAAIAASQRGAATEDAISEGKRWGMTRLEGAVREKLATSPP